MFSRLIDVSFLFVFGSFFSPLQFPFLSDVISFLSCCVFFLFFYNVICGPSLHCFCFLVSFSCFWLLFLDVDSLLLCFRIPVCKLFGFLSDYVLNFTSLRMSRVSS